MTAIAFPRVFEELASPAGAAPATIRAAFDAILEGAWTPVQVAGFAVALRLRGETASVITAAAESMRAVMIGVAASWGRLFPELAHMGRLEELQPEPRIFFTSVVELEFIGAALGDTPLRRHIFGDESLMRAEVQRFR